MHSLWNEIIGFFFLCFAAIFGFRAFTYYRSYTHAPPSEAFSSLMAVVLTILIGLMMLAFGISSFRKALKISRS